MKSNQNRVDTVFVLMIFCVFAVSVFLVLMLSGSTYSNIVRMSGEGQNERIALSYIRTRVRNADSAESVFVGEFHGLSALRLKERFDEHTFVTQIYLYDGWIFELFHMEGLEFMPQDGVPIIRADYLSFYEITEGLIRVSTDTGSLLIHTRSSTGTESEGS